MPSCRCQVLILSPTRELAQQTEKVILSIGDFLQVHAHSCIGGKSLGRLGSWLREVSHVLHETVTFSVGRRGHPQAGSRCACSLGHARSRV